MLFSTLVVETGLKRETKCSIKFYKCTVSNKEHSFQQWRLASKKRRDAAIRGAENFWRIGQKFKNGTFQQTEIFSVSLMEEIFNKKLIDEQKINK